MNYNLIKYFLYFPRKYFFLKSLNLIKYFLFKKYRFDHVSYKPITMDIEPTTGCNFRCTMCQVSEENFIAKNLDFEIFKKVVDENKQLLKIKLQGIGEPFEIGRASCRERV